MEDILKLSVSAAATEFHVLRLQLMYVSLPKNFITASLIFMVFSCLHCCHSLQNHFFHLYQQSKSSTSKVKFRQASNSRVFQIVLRGGRGGGLKILVGGVFFLLGGGGFAQGIFFDLLRLLRCSN